MAFFYDQIAWSIAQDHGIVNRTSAHLNYPRFVALIPRRQALVFAAPCVARGRDRAVAIYYLARRHSKGGRCRDGHPHGRELPAVFPAAAIGHQAIDVPISVLLVGALRGRSGGSGQASAPVQHSNRPRTPRSSFVYG
jgi:hypothetical protein